MFRQINRFAKTNGEFLSLRPRYSQEVTELRGNVDIAIDWEATHGLLMRAPKLSHPGSNAEWLQTALVPAPVSLAPSPIPRAEFDKVVALQPVFNRLFDRVAHDHDFLVSTLQSLGTADEFTARIFSMGDTEIAVAYYRAGYAPTDFPTEKEWEGRWLVEKSRTIPIPNLAYHLAGCKKIQQVLAQPGIVERFVGDEETAKRVRECFVGLYPLDDSEEGQQAYEMALNAPENYVVKPQREGGGYNTYGEDIPKLLREMTMEERRGHILMELIRAPGFDSMLLRNGQLVPAEVVSELGIYGIWVSNSKGDVVVNRHGGHLLRTKASNVHEGGVAAGFAVIDSPLLV
ncbi:Glutathione synthetase [Coemansia guatemalensis]|uniref:Glutathione synthetase n=1 Tax=Coemansia guatemalensis TaxID=2761395 RepID=A0A9W8LV51_9FUNG|nr:Glutathione synthetase [Coemansia guatemalensis]